MSPSKSTSVRLSLLADTTLTSLYERDRLLHLGTTPSPADDAEIQRSLDTLKLGLAQLEKELEDLELQEGIPPQELALREDILIKLQTQYDRLRRMMSGGDAVQDGEVRPKRGKSIRLPEDGDLEAQRSTSPGPRKTVRFSDSNTYETTPTRSSDDFPPSSEVLAQQRQTMIDQDESLDRLSESIGRQRELSIQIGDELDSQNGILDDLDEMLHRSRTRLTGARRRLGRFSKKAKDNGIPPLAHKMAQVSGSMLVIGVLILILIILIIIFK